LAVSSLLSPPEAKRSDTFSSSPLAPAMARTPLSSFSSDITVSAMRDQPLSKPVSQMSKQPGLPPSPPISPETQKENVECAEEEIDIRDPQLFKSNANDHALAADVPLFPEAQVDAAISKHIATARSTVPAPLPKKEDYQLFVASVMSGFMKDPKTWWKREREQQDHYGPSVPTKGRKRPAPAPLKKLAPAPSGVKKHKVAATVPRVQREKRTQKRTPKVAVHDSFETTQRSTQPKAPRPQTNRDDTDYMSIPDFCPPLSTLPAGSKSLKADWKGPSLDLSNDPDRHLLHEAEVSLAATLRLTCATYLCSKRRIFIGRIEALKKNKEFRKTDAQQACKIDVNKASKLWSAYERVGWFNPEYFNKH
ncbi:hypothetical protein BDY21DRAFT_272555, partial [Lineolata rhizophorae]